MFMRPVATEDDPKRHSYGLKIPRLNSRAGSSPAPGTNNHAGFRGFRVFRKTQIDANAPLYAPLLNTKLLVGLAHCVSVGRSQVSVFLGHKHRAVAHDLTKHC